MPELVQRFAKRLARTPLHPQWFAFLREERHLAASCARLDGIVVDIGCADCKPRNHLPVTARYVGVDYLATATTRYRTRPDVYGDARALPLADGSADHVLLLDVLEHIPDPGRCLEEIGRILKPGGTLTIQTPFLYPIHDAPLDFHRWTGFGMKRAARQHGFSIVEEMAVGHPLESAALNANIAFSKTVLNWIGNRNPLALLVVVLPATVVLANCIAWLLAAVSKPDDMMPYAYRMVWSRQ